MRSWALGCACCRGTTLRVHLVTTRPPVASVGFHSQRFPLCVQTVPAAKLVENSLCMSSCAPEPPYPGICSAGDEQLTGDGFAHDAATPLRAPLARLRMIALGRVPAGLCPLVGSVPEKGLKTAIKSTTSNDSIHPRLCLPRSLYNEVNASVRGIASGTKS